MKQVNFKQQVLKIVKTIPKGQIMSYKRVATLVGKSQAYRVVGNILNKNHDSDIPCHRVVKSDGSLGGYNRGRDVKQRLLEAERHNNIIIL